MRHVLRAGGRAALAAAMVVGVSRAASAQANVGWFVNVDLNFGLTGGNSKTLNFGAKADLTRNWLRNNWKTTASAVKTDVSEPGRRAVGTTLANAVLETGDLVTKSEKLFANTDFRHRITERFFWNLGGSLERDEFAGLDLRSTGVAGVGYMFDNKTDSTVTVGVGATFTSQSEVVDDPSTENSFAGLRGTLEGDKKFGDRRQNTFSTQFILDENLQQTDDLRFNWNTSLAFSISSHTDFKVGVQLAYDNLPQLVEFPFFQRVGAGLVETQQRKTAPAEKLDTTVTVALVIKFAPGGPASRPGR
jgi:uncharacterized protein DUF481